MTPAEVKSELLLMMGERSDYSDARQYLHISLAEKELAYGLRLHEVRTEGNIVLITDTRIYSLKDNFPDLYAVTGVYYPTLGRKLSKRGPDYFDRIATFPEGPPNLYMRYGDYLYLDALPTSNENNTNLYVRYLKLIDDIDENSTAFTLSEPFHEAILLGAAVRAHRAFREYEQAEYMKAEYLALVRSRLNAIYEEGMYDDSFPLAPDLTQGVI